MTFLGDLQDDGCKICKLDSLFQAVTETVAAGDHFSMIGGLVLSRESIHVL